MEPSPEEPVPVPQPVIKTDVAVAAIVLLLSQLNPAARHFGWWDLSGEDVDYIGQIIGAVLAFAIVIKGLVVRERVTPNENVAVTKAQVSQLTELPAVLNLESTGPTEEDAAYLAHRARQLEEATQYLREHPTA